MILNLDKNFKPFGDGIEFERFDFPSGCEPHIKINADISDYILTTPPIQITCRIKKSDDLITLLLATDALKRMGYKIINLFLPYLPFARQDRVMVQGEPLSIRVISDLLNMQCYNRVTVYDVHSEVALALINNSQAINNHSFIKKVFKYVEDDYLIVSPDAGAYKKIFKLCQDLNYTNEIVLCNKTRNVQNGQIINVTCSVDNLQGKDLFIIDDICDGGVTFILLANELKKRNCGKINLIVSHGIFSKGIEALKDVDKIYTTDSFNDLESTDKLTQIQLCSIL